MFRQLDFPRPIAAHEAQVIRRVLEVGAESTPPRALLNSVSRLIVHADQWRESAGGSLCFSSSFANRRIIASAIGMSPNHEWSELLLWACGSRMTHLELAPFEVSHCPPRLPTLASIRACPQSLTNFVEENPLALTAVPAYLACR